MLTPAQRLALWADRLRDISAMGLAFSENIHDRANYREIQNIAMAMLALASGETIERLEPLRAPIFSRPTPLSTADSAIIDTDGQILLIRRADNQRWALPGGALAVGETPAAGAVREAFEETGVRCEPIALIGVYDSRLCGTVSHHHIYHFVFLCRPANGKLAEQAPTHASEVLDAGWFSEERLPVDLDSSHTARIQAAFRAWRGEHRAYFDR